MNVCTNCGATSDTRPGQWWGLGNYYGVSGTFCPDCYELVSHDPYRKPRHPTDYEAIKTKQLAKGRPCRSPYCECTPGQCTHPGCYDARGTS